jgi:hypothetical protein
MDEYANEAASALLPEWSRVSSANTKQGFDPLSLLGGTVGVSNHSETGTQRVKQALSQSVAASKAFSQVEQSQGQEGVKSLLSRDPDTVIYAAFAPALQQFNRQLQYLDRAQAAVEEQTTGKEREDAMQKIANARAQMDEEAGHFADQLYAAQQAIHARQRQQSPTAVEGAEQRQKVYVP